ncbi:archaea bacterial proteins of unknown function [Peptococcaceae bacterium CEB3]|nr:archaea bacterial proteins of unknown function [Peptococcaceae bacterium CEB3]
MWELNAKGRLPFCFDKVGRWWNNNTEIDLVAYDSTGQDILFGECKYTKEPMDIDIFYTLLEKKKAVIWNKDNRRESFIFFSINGYTERMKALAAVRNDILLCEQTL